MGTLGPIVMGVADP